MQVVQGTLGGYPGGYVLVPGRYYIVPTFLPVLWVLWIVPMGTIGYYRGCGVLWVLYSTHGYYGSTHGYYGSTHGYYGSTQNGVLQGTTDICRRRNAQG